MNPSVTAYFNAEAGHIGYVSGARTARFAFTTPASGATSLSFHTADFSLRSPSGNDGHSTAFGFRFALTTDENAYNGYVGGAGIAANAQIGAALSGSLSQNLQPNTTYYLFLFPSSTIYCDWYIESLSVTLMGVYVTASSLSAEDGAFGHPLSISLSRSVNGVTHTVTASCAGRTELLARQTE